MLRALTVVHPVPSVINAALVASLAAISGAERWVIVSLAIAMLGFQFSIGALNDVVDADTDRRYKPRKPIPAGLVSVRTALVVVVLGAAVGVIISAGFGQPVIALGVAGYSCGVAYDLLMRRHGLGWLCLAAALPIMLAWTWLSAVGSLPPGWQTLLPLAALAGPAVHLGNSLVDLDSDGPAGRRSLATRLGPAGARTGLTLLMALILVLAWLTLASVAAVTGVTLAAAITATAIVSLGLALSWQESTRAREAGWLSQASGLAILAAAWLAAMTSM